MRRNTPTLLLILSLVITSCSSTSVADEEALFENEGNNAEAVELNISEKETQVYNVVNDYRTANGLSALIFSAETYKYAKQHTQFMIVADKISHDNFNDRATKIAKQTNAIHIAENVAKNYPEAEMALEGWLESASHKNTIEGDFTHTAVCVKENSKGKLFYTQIFFKK